jgi:oligopeptide/dipeptide ABC transporter ATP-binding protein
VVEHENSVLLKISDLKTYFYTDDGVVKAVDGVDLEINRSEIVGLVGESGCGKSVTSLSVLRLISSPGKIIDGKVVFNGQDLLALSESEMTRIRGNKISMIFQQPTSSLNPVFKVGSQIAEVLRVHRSLSKEAAWEQAKALLQAVGIPDPQQKANSYPFELSGGQAQRVMIAMALALNPDLLIADEPTTALDVTIQAQILDLIRTLRADMGAAVILITHDLGVIAEMADRVAVMYAGRIVEEAFVNSLFAKPLHPYTQGLIASIPVLGEVKDRLEVIPGSVPDLIDLPSGCRFAARCRAREQYHLSICEHQEPGLIPVFGDHSVRCWLYLDHQEHRAPLRGSLAARTQRNG